MQTEPVIWLPRGLQDQCMIEAGRMFPRETGGIFMGYWSDVRNAIVTTQIGPGPNAIHERYNFEPDYEWQRQRIADHYERSGRMDDYLGDWHTHPDALSATLSRQDRSVLRRIIGAAEARSPTPLMMILYGTPLNWSIGVWRSTIHNRTFLWPKLIIEPCTLQVF